MAESPVARPPASCLSCLRALCYRPRQQVIESWRRGAHAVAAAVRRVFGVRPRRRSARDPSGDDPRSKHPASRCASAHAEAHLHCVSAHEDGRIIDLGAAEYWDIRYIQFHCRVSRSTAWRMVDEPDFPRRLTYGRCVRWPRSEVMQFLENRREQPQPAERRLERRSAASSFATRPVRRRSASRAGRFRRRCVLTGRSAHLLHVNANTPSGSHVAFSTLRRKRELCPESGDA